MRQFFNLIISSSFDFLFEKTLFLNVVYLVLLTHGIGPIGYVEFVFKVKHNKLFITHVQLKKLSS